MSWKSMQWESTEMTKLIVALRTRVMYLGLCSTAIHWCHVCILMFVLFPSVFMRGNLQWIVSHSNLHVATDNKRCFYAEKRSSVKVTWYFPSSLFFLDVVMQASWQVINHRTQSLHVCGLIGTQVQSVSDAILHTPALRWCVASSCMHHSPFRLLLYSRVVHLRNLCFPIYWLTDWLTNWLTMKQSPSWVAKRSSASQDIPRILWNSNAHYLIHRSPPPILFLSQINPLHDPSNFLKVHFNIIVPSTSRSSKWFFPSHFPNKTFYAPLLSPVCAKCLAHLIFLYFIIRITL
jgi:hypothetical protein